MLSKFLFLFIYIQFCSFFHESTPNCINPRSKNPSLINLEKEKMIATRFKIKGGLLTLFVEREKLYTYNVPHNNASLNDGLHTTVVP